MGLINQKNMHKHEYIDIAYFNGVHIAVSIDFFWIFYKGEQHINLKEDKIEDSIFWLPILETDYLSINNELRLSLRENKLSEEIIASFPFNNIIDVALRSNSQYWVPLAFGWLKEIGDKAYFKKSLQLIIDNKKYSQGIRHTSMKYLAQIKHN
jgi:hypothetical protein